jgi:3,4-dihydroxy 2-butanone 4-phosphate synthase / GTP cyclohydrolase II
MHTIPEILTQLRTGGMVIMIDDEDRENEGDIIVAAEHATPDVINFLVTHARGLVCLPMAGAMMDRFDMPAMVQNNKAHRSTAFSVSIEARDGITTGISAFDRAHTISVAINPSAKREDIVSPGHVFPLRAAEGGVMKRQGHTEAAVDLMVMAGLKPAAVICEVMADNGEMMRRPALEIFAQTHNLPICTIEALVKYRKRHENFVEKIAEANLPSAHADGALRVHAFRNTLTGVEHLAVVKGPLGKSPLIRVHSECATGDILGSLRCDCGPQLQKSLQLVAAHEAGGVVIYLRDHEGRGIGLGNKIAAYALQDRGHDTISANRELGFGTDERDYTTAAHILKSLGVEGCKLLSNNPDKRHALQELGIAVEEMVPLVIPPNPFNTDYIAIKRDHLGHFPNIKGAN